MTSPSGENVSSPWIYGGITSGHSSSGVCTCGGRGVDDGLAAREAAVRARLAAFSFWVIWMTGTGSGVPSVQRPSGERQSTRNGLIRTTAIHPSGCMMYCSPTRSRSARELLDEISPLASRVIVLADGRSRILVMVSTLPVVL